MHSSPQVLFRRPDGFPNQRILIFPDPVIERIKASFIASQLFPTRIGFFPNASNHYIERNKPIEDHIIIVCLRGEGHGTVNGVPFSLQSGKIVILPAGKKHSYAASRSNPWTISWIHYQGTLAESFHKGMQVSDDDPTVEITKPEINRTFFETIYGLTGGTYSDTTLIQLHTKLADYFATIAYHRRETVPNRRESAERVSLTIRYMHENLDQPISIETLAKIANWTPNHFSNVFRKQTNDTPAAFFMHLKMIHACECLKTTDRTIASIAHEVGFEDPFYFSRCFRRYYQMPPSEFRNLYF